MIATAALAAALTLFLLAAWLAGELTILAPYRAALLREHGDVLVLAAVVVWVNLWALYYSLARWVLFRDTGRKLRHLDRQLATRDGALDELRARLSPEEDRR